MNLLRTWEVPPLLEERREADPAVAVRPDGVGPYPNHVRLRTGARSQSGFG